MSVNSTSPNTLFGGTWERIQNKFLLSAGSSYSAGSTGGNANTTLSVSNLPSHNHSYTKATGVANHTLTINEIPSHKHDIYTSTFVVGQWNGSGTCVGGSTKTDAVGAMGGGQAHNHNLNTESSTTGNQGSGSSFSNMPPYLSVYVWKRTA